MFHSTHEIICNSDACTATRQIEGVDAERAKWLFEDLGWVFATWTIEDLTYCPTHVSEA